MNTFSNIIRLLNSVKISIICDLIIKELRRRIYSNEIVYICNFDLTRNIEVPEPCLPLTLRPLVEKDIPELLVKHSGMLDAMELKTRLAIMGLINSGIKTCYVGVTDHGRPVVLNWLIASEMNDKIEHYFGAGIQPIKPDEVLFDYIFVHYDYRGLRLHDWSTSKLFLKAKELGASKAVAYGTTKNPLSWKVAKRFGWRPYIIKRVRWRMFRRRISFDPYVPDSQIGDMTP